MYRENANPASNCLQSAVSVFSYYRELAEKALSQVREEETHWQPNPESNSIAVIMKHMSGNMLSRWTDFLTADGEKPWRNRDTEFVDDIDGMDSLFSIWQRGWACLFSALDKLTDQDLEKIVYIRNEGHTVLEAVNRQLTHYAYHVGQIVYAAKALRSEHWQTLSVPRGGSDSYNEEMFKRPKRLRRDR